MFKGALVAIDSRGLGAVLIDKKNRVGATLFRTLEKICGKLYYSTYDVFRGFGKRVTRYRFLQEFPAQKHSSCGLKAFFSKTHWLMFSVL